MCCRKWAYAVLCYSRGKVPTGVVVYTQSLMDNYDNEYAQDDYHRLACFSVWLDVEVQRWRGGPNNTQQIPTPVMCELSDRFGDSLEDALASKERSRIFLMGTRRSFPHSSPPRPVQCVFVHSLTCVVCCRSGKSSIQKVVFHKMSPHETLFLESTNDVHVRG